MRKALKRGHLRYIQGSESPYEMKVVCGCVRGSSSAMVQ